MKHRSRGYVTQSEQVRMSGSVEANASKVIETFSLGCSTEGFVRKIDKSLSLCVRNQILAPEELNVYSPRQTIQLALQRSAMFPVIIGESHRFAPLERGGSS